jgi:dihydrodipicolinate synthase/N-acetylneuraminate lyase
MNELGGVISAIITPMKKDRTVDFKAISRQVEFLASAGVHGYFVNGTTAEGPYLNRSERKKCFEIVKANKAKEQFICLACIAPSTKEVIEEMKDMEPLEPDYFVSVPPFYYALDALSIEQHYQAISIATKKPIIIYNIPQRTVNDVFSANIANLITSGRFAGMKDSSGNFIRFASHCLDHNNSFKWIQGEDLLDAPSLLVGASGIVTGLSNIFPEPFIKMYNAYRESDIETMKNCQKEINKMAKIIDISQGMVIPAIKEAVAILGRAEPWSRVYSERLPANIRSKIKTIITEF